MMMNTLLPRHIPGRAAVGIWQRLDELTLHVRCLGASPCHDVRKQKESICQFPADYQPAQPCLRGPACTASPMRTFASSSLAAAADASQLPTSSPSDLTLSDQVADAPLVDESPATQPAAKHGPSWPTWDWAFVTGSKAGRKQAIKKPSRHQWYFCNPNYNPHHPLPPKMLSPYAPITAQQQDEKKVYWKLKPHHRQRNNKRYQQEYQRWLALRDVDWRQAFQQGLAEDTKAATKMARRELERKRQEAWAQYKAELFRQAALPPQEKDAQ